LRRVGYIAKIGYARASATPIPTDEEEEQQIDNAPIDFEQYADDAIEKFIIQKYKGHGLARLIDAILRASGFTTHVNPPESDRVWTFSLFLILWDSGIPASVYRSNPKIPL